jgi:hypothetical protein
MIGTDDLEQRIQGGCLRPVGTKAGDALAHLDPLRFGSGGLGGKARTRISSVVGLGLRQYQRSARLMGDVATRP